jgi:hypothetical protein
VRRLTLCFAVSLVACASNDGIQVSDEEYDDLAMSLASTAHTAGGGGELGAMADVMKLASGSELAGFAAEQDGMVRGQHQGLAYEYAFTCFDAANNLMATCDARTDRAEVNVAWAGMLNLPLLAMAIERHGLWTLSDLRTGTAHLEGDGHMTYESSIAAPDRGETTTYTLASDPTYEAISIAGSPNSGTMHYIVDVTRKHGTDNTLDTRRFQVDATIEVLPVHVLITLDDARIPPEEPQDTHVYDVDLATGVVVRVAH